MQRQQLAVTVCGETVADLVEQPDGRLDPIPGGSPANTALALSRLGHDVRMLARLSTDTFGRRARARLVDNGVDTDDCVVAREPSTLAVVTVGGGGHPTYDFWTEGTADWQWTTQELAEHPRPGTALIHTASVAAWLSPGESVIEGMLHRAALAGVVVSYDPNVRPPLMPDLDEARRRIEAKVRVADVVKISDEDLEVLFPDTDADTVVRRWLDGGPQVVVVTRGPKGSTAIRKGADAVTVPIPPIEVADTVGAGDTFTAGMWHAVASLDSSLTSRGADGLREILASMDDEDWRTVLGVAAAAAGINCSRVGCDPPTRTELSAATSALGDGGASSA